MAGVIQKARAWLGRKIAGDARVPGIFQPPVGGSAYFGQAYRWEQILHYKYWAFIAIRARINEIAGGEPPNLGRVIYGDTKSKKLVRKILGGPREHEGFEPYDHMHPLVRVFRNPNGPDVAYDLWAYHTLFKSLTGMVHWWVIRNAFGVPVEIWIIPTHWARLVTGGDGQPSYYIVQSPWGHATEIPFDEIVTFYDQSPLNRYEGAAVSQAVGEWIDVYEAMTRMRLATFNNNAVPAIHIQLGESYANPDDQFIERFYAKWLARFQGPNNSGRPLITGADTEIKGVDGHRPADALAASNASEEQIRDMVLSAYGVPKGVVGLEPISDVSAYAPQRAFCRFTINPELKYTGEVITEKIVKVTPNCSDGVCFWHDRVANDVEFEENKLRWDVEHGLRTPNEGRTERGLEIYPHGGNNPILNGQEMPWKDGKRPDDSEFAGEFKKVMSGTSGAAGGYTEP